MLLVNLPLKLLCVGQQGEEDELVQKNPKMQFGASRAPVGSVSCWKGLSHEDQLQEVFWDVSQHFLPQDTAPGTTGKSHHRHYDFPDFPCFSHTSGMAFPPPKGAEVFL